MRSRHLWEKNFFSFIHFFSVSKFKHLLTEVGRKVVKCVNYRKHLVTSFPVLFWTPKIGHWKNGGGMGEGWANFWPVKDRLPPSLQKRKPCCPQQDLWENLNPPFGKAPKGRWKFKVPQDPIKLPPPHLLGGRIPCHWRTASALLFNYITNTKNVFFYGYL